MLNYNVLKWVYYIVFCCKRLYYIRLYCIVWKCVILYCVVLYCILLYCIILVCFALCCVVGNYVACCCNILHYTLTNSNGSLKNLVNCWAFNAITSIFTIHFTCLCRYESLTLLVLYLFITYWLNYPVLRVVPGVYTTERWPFSLSVFQTLIDTSFNPWHKTFCLLC